MKNSYILVLLLILLAIGLIYLNKPRRIELTQPEVKTEDKYLKLLNQGCFENEVPVACKG